MQDDDPLALHVRVVEAHGVQPVHAGVLQDAQVVGVMDHAHAVGLVVAHMTVPDPGSLIDSSYYTN